MTFVDGADRDYAQVRATALPKERLAGLSPTSTKYALAIQRLELAAEACSDEIERLWELQCTWLVQQEWDRLRARRLAIEATIRRLER